MTLSNREKALMVILVWAVITYAAVHYFITPVLGQVSELRQKNQELQQYIDREKRLAARLEELKKEQAEMEERLARMSGKVPQTPAVPEIISYVNGCAAKAGVRLNSIGYGQGGEAKVNVPGQQQGSEVGIRPVKLDISVTGRYFSLIPFLWEIEDAPRLYNIMSMSITSPMSASGEGEEPAVVTDNLTMSLTMEAYYSEELGESPGQAVEQVAPPQQGKKNPFGQ